MTRKPIALVVDNCSAYYALEFGNIKVFSEYDINKTTSGSRNHCSLQSSVQEKICGLDLLEKQEKWISTKQFAWPENLGME